MVHNFALFRGYIVTANEDGSIPINAKMVCQVVPDSVNETLMAVFLGQANGKIRDARDVLDKS